LPAQNHSSFRAPENPEIKVWRYLSLAKFVSFLQARALYFCRIDKLDDPWEGHYARGDTNRVSPTTEVWLESIRKYNEANKIKSSPEDELMWALKASAGVSKINYVNCWHMSSSESIAMWQIYGSRNDSLAVQSTYRRLFDVLPSSCAVGVVRYLNYDYDEVSMNDFFTAALCKRDIFDHEKELRCVLLQGNESGDEIFEPLPDGVNVKVDIDSLIEKIYISPVADTFIIEVIRRLASTYSLSVPIVQSKINSAPEF
jgi:hypothetical protein